MQYIIGPGVLPVVTALSKDIMSKTFWPAGLQGMTTRERWAISTALGFGSLMYFDEAGGGTIVAWECLYGVV